MELYIIRHGQSTNNALMEDTRLRVKDPELTEVGWQQARLVADFLANSTNLEALVYRPVDAPERKQPHPYHFTHLYCSPMHRAMQTAQPIAEVLDMAPQVWVDIHEMGGIFIEDNGVVKGDGGLTRAEMLKLFPNYSLPESITEDGWWNPSNGKEPLAQVYARAVNVAMALRERAMVPETANDRIAMVAHGAFMDCLLKALLNMVPDDRFFMSHFNTAMTRVDLREDGKVFMRYTNRVTHLPPELVT